ncbi:MAG: hypothetical protein H8M99_00045 [Gloeobacteraceae cyanobacterium ES-bin-144]|nr:hypothetical protein [Verrucomicrobiales bacterium]
MFDLTGTVSIGIEIEIRPHARGCLDLNATGISTHQSSLARIWVPRSRLAFRCNFQPSREASQGIVAVVIRAHMAEESSKPKPKGGCLGKFVVLILLVAALGLGTALFFIIQPQDLTNVGGNSVALKFAPVRDLTTVLKSSIDRGYPVTLTETEINQWLGRTLRTKQGGLLGGQISLDRVWVRLEDDYAEVIMERKLMGSPFTTSMFIRIDQMQGAKGVVSEVHLDGGPYHESVPNPPRGGRFGKLVVPQGFLILVMPAYKKLAAVFKDEIHLGFEEMAKIKISKGRLMLDPRASSNDPTTLPKSF